MSSLRPHPLETLLTALAGWLPLLGGLTLLAMTLITPEWLSWRELVWQRDMLRLQAEGLEKQRAGYTDFHDALAADDPVLLERLAFTHLRYKPTSKRLMGDLWLASTGPGDHASGQGNVSLGTSAGLGGPIGTSEMIESWLATPQPVIGRDIQPLRPINSRMTRLTSGSSRYVLLFVAILCLVAGLWPERRDPQEANASADHTGPSGLPRRRLTLVRPPGDTASRLHPVRKRA